MLIFFSPFLLSYSTIVIILKRCVYLILPCRTPCMSCSLRIRRQVNSALRHLPMKEWGRLVGRRGEEVCGEVGLGVCSSGRAVGGWFLLEWGG